MEKIFDNWNEAIHKLPLNQPVARYLKQTKICLVRLATDQIIAFKDACPHMGRPLSTGSITNNQAIICPWHRYTFDLHTGKECKGRNLVPLFFFDIISNEQGIFLDIPDKLAKEEKDDFSF